jgi:hypothetical protein
LKGWGEFLEYKMNEPNIKSAHLERGDVLEEERVGNDLFGEPHIGCSNSN